LLLKLCILCHDRFFHGFLHLVELCSQIVVRKCQHLYSQNCCIFCTVDCNGCYRNAGWHLYGGKQCIQTVQSGRFDRNTDDWQSGVCSQYAAQVSCFSSCRNDDAKAVCLCLRCKFACLCRCTVCAHHMSLYLNAKGFELINRWFYGWKIAVASHDNSNLFCSNV